MVDQRAKGARARYYGATAGSFLAMVEQYPIKNPQLLPEMMRR
jgi:hypothetical protein